ncbi:MAG TPA: TolC family protein [Polyangiaceae bacterium]|nr:TolC family protein [Polyangiaceae bacterium]
MEFRTALPALVRLVPVLTLVLGGGARAAEPPPAADATAEQVAAGGPTGTPTQGAAPSAAQPTATGPVRPPTSRGRRVLDLEQCLALAEANYPKVQEARARLVAKESQLREAHMAPFGEFTLSAGAGVVPIWRGTMLYSPNSDAALTPNLALAWQAGIEGVVPLWTFGKISNLWSAAESNVQVGKHDVRKERNAIRLEVRKAYFGLLLARDSILLLNDARGQLNQHREKLQADVDAGEGDDIGLLKVQMNSAELDARASEAQKMEGIALAGLRFFTGSQQEIDVPDEPLRRVPHELGPVARYLEAARLYRPEVNMVRAGVSARRAQLAVEEAKFFPDIGIGMAAKVVRAAEITDQRNPFAFDPANYAYYTAGLAMRWKLDFLPQSARISRAEAELEEMRATERYALGGVAVEVEKAFAEAEDARRRLEAWTRATHYAKQWLIKVQQGMELGLFEGSDIVEPAKEYAMKKFSEMAATYDYNVAVSQLAVATGWEMILDRHER